MDHQSILATIDAEIARLHQVRTLLANTGNSHGVRNKRRAKEATATKPKKRTLSAEARARIAEAQRKRWAAARRVSK
jgi:hypothetical protein